MGIVSRAISHAWSFLKYIIYNNVDDETFLASVILIENLVNVSRFCFILCDLLNPV